MPEPATMVGFAAGTAAVLGHLARRYFVAAKECVDVILGVIALLIALPTLIVCAAIIKISSPGPLFYTQVRVGQHGRHFRMYKLRTMRTDAEMRSGAMWAQKDDPRVIPACRWMRKSHVDELPQILNVIKGEMSLVGPRPERPEILAELEKHYPNVRDRLAVKPGITGLAQITNGYDSSIENFRHKLEADIAYIENRRWRQELKIMLGTFPMLNDQRAH